MIEDGGGYHAYFGLSSSALNSDDSFEVKEDATKVTNQSCFQEVTFCKENEQESSRTVHGITLHRQSTNCHITGCMCYHAPV